MNTTARLLIALAFLVVGASITSCKHADAQPPDPPTEIPPLRAMTFDRDVAKIEGINVACQAQLAPYVREATEIASEGKFPLGDALPPPFGRGTVKIDPMTGKITRAKVEPPPTQGALPK